MQLNQPPTPVGVRPPHSEMGCSETAKATPVPVLRSSSLPLLLSRNVWMAGDGSEFIRWCGLLLNVNTLEVRQPVTHTLYIGVGYEHVCTYIFKLSCLQYIYIDPFDFL